MSFEHDGDDLDAKLAQRRHSRPRIILPDETTRTSGRDARDADVSAARAVADAVRTTPGPAGMVVFR